MEHLVVELPEFDAIVMHTNYAAHAAGFGAKSRVAKQSSKVFRRIIRANMKPDDTVTRVAIVRLEEVLILGEESNASEFVQKREYVVIFYAQPTQITANPTESNSPSTQNWVLIFREVLVQQIHAGTVLGGLTPGARNKLPRSSSQASRDNFTASATAASGILPPHRFEQIKCHDRRSATSCNTCQTMIRVPLKVGFPWQISGSATMYRPNSTLCLRRFMEATIGASVKAQAVAEFLPQAGGAFKVKS